MYIEGNGVHEIGVCLTPAESRSWLYEACGTGFGGTEWAAPAPRMTGATAIVAGILVARHDHRRSLRLQAKPEDRVHGCSSGSVGGADHEED